MAKDPAFLFYPGDYLKDTQCLSEKSQVAYDRIMCEHMRNICITQQQLNFFTKRLSDEEKKEILFILKKIEGGFQIEWVAESICKRKDYSKSRAENRKGKSKNISSSYDPHMENANENAIKDEDVFKNEKSVFLIPEMFKVFKENNPKYIGSISRDFKPLLSIASFFCEAGNLTGSPDINANEILKVWEPVTKAISNDQFYKDKSLSTISNQIQTIIQTAQNGHSTTKTGNKHKATGVLIASLKQDYAARGKENT